MNRTRMGDIWPTIAQLWREIAHCGGRCIKAHDSSVGLCKSHVVDGSSSNRPTTHCQYRYPSPRRSGPFWARPTPLFCGPQGILRSFAGLVQKALVLTPQNAESLNDKTKQKKGSNQCLTSVLFSPRRPSRRFRHVSTATLSAGLPVPQPVPSLQTLWVVIPSRVQSLVALLAHCVTKSQTSAAKAKTRLSIGAANNFDRRSGTPCAAVLHFPTNISGGQ